MSIRLNHLQLAMVDLDTLPGGTELYIELAQAFLHAYDGHDESYEDCWCYMTEAQISSAAQRMREKQSGSLRRPAQRGGSSLRC